MCCWCIEEEPESGGNGSSLWLLWHTCRLEEKTRMQAALTQSILHSLSLLIGLCRAVLCCAGTMSRAEIEAGYQISRRIEAEERALDAALLVFTSTQQEVKDQWGLYDG
jgi:hypothetical protein